MNRFLISLSLIVLFQSIAIAQAEDAKEKAKEETYSFTHHKFFLRLGYSTPRGDYESTEPSDNSGFANNGRHIELGYEYRIKETIGLVFRYSNLNHGLQSSAYAAELDKQFRSLNPGTTFKTSVTFDDYKVNSFLISPRLYNEIGNNTFLVITPTFGFSSMVVGELKANTLVTGGSIIQTTQRETSAEVALMYGVAGGLSFRVSEEININVFAEYLEAEYNDIFAYVSAQVVGGAGAQTSSGYYDQKLQVLNFGIEIGYNF